MAEVIITIENLRYITRTLEAKRTNKIKVSIVGNLLKFEDLKTGERAEIQSMEEVKTQPFMPYAQTTQRLRERRQFTKRR